MRQYRRSGAGRAPRVLLAADFAGAAVLACRPSPVDGAARLQGAWRLVDVSEIDSAGHITASGPEPGLVIFSGTRFSRAWADTVGQPARFASPWSATDSEKLARFRAITVSAGRFELAGDTVIFRPTFAKVSSFEGGYSRDQYAFHGDTLWLTMTSIVAADGTPFPYYERGGRERQRLVRAE